MTLVSSALYVTLVFIDPILFDSYPVLRPMCGCMVICAWMSLCSVQSEDYGLSDPTCVQPYKLHLGLVLGCCLYEAAVIGVKGLSGFSGQRHSCLQATFGIAAPKSIIRQAAIPDATDKPGVFLFSDPIMPVACRVVLKGQTTPCLIRFWQRAASPVWPDLIVPRPQVV